MVPIQRLKMALHALHPRDRLHGRRDPRRHLRPLLPPRKHFHHHRVAHLHRFPLRLRHARYHHLCRSRRRLQRCPAAKVQHQLFAGAHDVHLHVVGRGVLVGVRTVLGVQLVLLLGTVKAADLYEGGADAVYV